MLAAEEFAVPAADPELKHGSVVLPEDPAGIAEPHDVLAAEEFAMPATTKEASPPSRAALGRGSRVAGAAGAALVVIGLARRRRR